METWAIPIIAKDTLEIFKYFREHNPNIWLSMNTNAGARDETWWAQLAKTFGLHGGCYQCGWSPHTIICIDKV